MKIEYINLDDINIQDNTYIVSYPLEDEHTTISIQKTHVQNPITIEKVNDKYVVINGIRRVTACRKLGLKQIPAYMPGYHEDDKIKKNFLDALFENGSHRIWNSIEKALIVKKITSEIKLDQNDFRQICSFIKIAENDYALNILLKLSKTSDEIKSAVITGELHINSAVLLTSFTRTERDTILGILKSLHTNINMNKELIRFFLEIMRRDKFGTINDLLKESGLAEIIDDQDIQYKRKYEMICSILKKKRYPELSKKEADFNDFKQNLLLPDKTNLFHFPFFEKQEYSIDIKFKDKHDLHEKMNKIIKGLSNIERPLS
ncbi:ParB N-terminal domain-containing protein [bacterium]